MTRNVLRPRPDVPDIPGETEKSDMTDGARPPKNNKPLRTHYYYD